MTTEYAVLWKKYGDLCSQTPLPTQSEAPCHFGFGSENTVGVPCLPPRAEHEPLRPASEE